MPVLVASGALDILIHVDVLVELFLFCGVFDFVYEEIAAAVVVFLTKGAFWLVLFWSTICNYMAESVAFEAYFFLWAVLGLVVLWETVKACWDLGADLSKMAYFITSET